MPNVIVVPETDDFKLHVSHENIVWITRRLGVPLLEEHNAHYLAPFWLGEPRGVSRIYHIPNLKKVIVDDESTDIPLGNSFVLEKPWTGVGQYRRFEYHSLRDFGFEEDGPGILRKISPGS